MYRVHFYLFVKVQVVDGYDIHTEVLCDFMTIEEVWNRFSDARESSFAIRIRNTASCALRLKQQKQAHTALPMSPNLIALLDEHDNGVRCVCHRAGEEPNHVDMFDQSPDFPEGSVDAFHEHAMRQRFLKKLHERGY